MICLSRSCSLPLGDGVPPPEARRLLALKEGTIGRGALQSPSSSLPAPDTGRSLVVDLDRVELGELAALLDCDGSALSDLSTSCTVRLPRRLCCPLAGGEVLVPISRSRSSLMLLLRRWLPCILGGGGAGTASVGPAPWCRLSSGVGGSEPSEVLRMSMMARSRSNAESIWFSSSFIDCMPSSPCSSSLTCTTFIIDQSPSPLAHCSVLTAVLYHPAVNSHLRRRP